MKPASTRARWARLLWFRWTPPIPKNPQVKIKAGKPLAKPVTLAEVKANKLFADSPLVRQGRLSVVPLTAGQFKFLTGE